MDNYIVVYSQPNKNGKLVQKEAQVRAEGPDQAVELFKEMYFRVYDNIKILDVTLSLF